ncbi:MAG TPA: hypothetical protein VFE22_04795 [Edaphobacter sp.]|nr:hypothetical protein [Edaphobacter sp.]
MVIINQSSFRDIARQWRVSKDSLARHKEHIPQALAKAQAAQEVARADSLLGEVKEAKGAGKGSIAPLRRFWDERSTTRTLGPP